MIKQSAAKKKILFVAMQTSIHTVRWINQISAEYDVHLFAVDRGVPHPELRSVTIHQPFYTGGFPRWIARLFGRESSGGDETIPDVKPRWDFYFPNKLLGCLCKLFRVYIGTGEGSIPYLFGPAMLARVIIREKPDLIHSLEFQHCSYLVLEARRVPDVCNYKWWATNWGSDVHYFQQFANHKRIIEKLFAELDIYSCECERDISYARQLGFNGIAMPVLPNTGGFDLSLVKGLRTRIPASDRKVILVKGYQAFVGRALTALDSLELISDELRDYQIVVYSACPAVRDRVLALRKSNALQVECSEKMAHWKMLELFSSARVYLGVSLSDGISTSLLEAMALGAFPIQTSTSCCNEWIEHGSTGFEVPCDNAAVISECVKKALNDDGLVDAASRKNWEVVSTKLDREKLCCEVQKMYETAFNVS